MYALFFIYMNSYKFFPKSHGLLTANMALPESKKSKTGTFKQTFDGFYHLPR